MQQRDEWGRDEAAERVGLVGPVEAARATSVIGEGMLCLVVVFQHLSY